MSRHRAIFLVVVTLTAMLAGCTKGHFIELWNNTGVDVVIVVDDERLTIKTGGMGTIRWLKDQQQLNAYVGKTEKKTFAFRYPTPLESFQVQTATKTLIRLQLNADDFIYALPPEATGIMQSVPAQPTDYPLKPK